jgi:omega-hydroxy-beta-dihydromenaquinone-9 sulfotransferase
MPGARQIRGPHGPGDAGLRGRAASDTVAHRMACPLKHRWSVGNNYLAGITAGDWLRLLREQRFAVDSAYWHRAAFIALTSVFNSIARRSEERRFHGEIAATSVAAPLFILGHWRSGTTHLHNLLARDSERFAFPNTYQVVNPHTFLTTEAAASRRFAWMVPPTRPMDAMEMGFALPQEDELALCLMCRRSPYLAISFPRAEVELERYLDFEGVPEREVAEWKASLTYFLRKLTLKCGRPLVLKSPTHTARIRLLLELFPDARFIHIHRHPYQVFRSCRHYHDTATWFTYLQRPDRDAVDQHILRRYTRLHDAFFAQRGLIPKGRIHEIRFDDLERDPEGELETLYAALGLGDFATFRPKLRAYLETLGGYRKNEFQPLDEATRRTVAEAWSRSFETWNYPK